MNLIRKAAAVAAIAGLAVVGWAVPASSVDATGGPVGYTVVRGDSGCDLATVDLATGALTDLPAASSPDACAVDLAVSPSGTVWGIWGGTDQPTGLSTQASEPGVLVRYAADGSATTVTISDAEGTGDAFLAEGGIAVAPNGTVYVHLVTDNPACNAGGDTPDTTISPLYAGDSVCLFTVDPGTGAATIVGTTGLFQTAFSQLAWCNGLVSIADTGDNGSWVTESTSTGAVTIGAGVDAFPAGYDCNTTTGSPLYALVGEPSRLEGGSTQADSAVSVATVDPATGATTIVAPLSDQAANVIALAVSPTAVPPPAVAADTVTPAFTG